MGEARHAIDNGEVYLNLRGDEQHLGLPGSVAIPLGSAGLPGNPKATASPNDYGDLQGLNVTLGGTRTLSDGIDLVVDAGVRHKEQQALYASFGMYSSVVLNTYSLTPRIVVTQPIFGMPSRGIVGIDVYDSDLRLELFGHQGGICLRPSFAWAIDHRRLRAGYAVRPPRYRPCGGAAAGERRRNGQRMG